MIRFRIADKHTAEKLLSAPDAYAKQGIGPFEHIVSIGNPEYKTEENPEGTGDHNKPKGLDAWSVERGDGLLRLKFHDLEESQNFIRSAADNTLITGFVPPSEDDVKRIIEFAQTIKGSTLIHCDAGISRSSAACIICLYCMLGDEQQAVSIAHQLKDDIMPNRLMLQYADKLLGSDLMSALLYRQ